MASDSLLTSDSVAESSTTVLSSANTREQFLRFQLDTETTVLLPISQIAEVLTIPIDQITPIPQLPAWVMGAYNWRGEVLWMVDLAHLIGLTPWHQQGISATYSIIVLRVRSMSTLTNAENQMIGLVINRAEMMEWCDPDLLQSPSSDDVIAPELIPFLRGYQLKSNGEQLAVLDDEVIVTAISQS